MLKGYPYSVPWDSLLACFRQAFTIQLRMQRCVRGFPRMPHAWTIWASCGGPKDSGACTAVTMRVGRWEGRHVWGSSCHDRPRRQQAPFPKAHRRIHNSLGPTEIQATKYQLMEGFEVVAWCQTTLTMTSCSLECRCNCMLSWMIRAG